MLQRKIDKTLLEWKNQSKKKCLVVDGARQVGKTFAIRQFGESYYDELFYINFKETPSAKDIFSGRFDVIASGSMLGIDYKRASSYPVGYVDNIKMHGLDFEEFLWSQGIDEPVIDGIACP